jgi:hypothetical protein
MLLKTEEPVQERKELEQSLVEEPMHEESMRAGILHPLDVGF